MRPQRVEIRPLLDDDDRVGPQRTLVAQPGGEVHRCAVLEAAGFRQDVGDVGVELGQEPIARARLDFDRCDDVDH